MANNTTNFLQTVKFYDFSLEENYNMYDKMPYIRDWGLTGFDAVKMVSGNVIKYYGYKEKDNYFKVPADRKSK